MSDYLINVATVQLPTGTKFVRLAAQIQDSELMTAMLVSPQIARSLAAELIKAADIAERLIERPGEIQQGLRIGDLTKGN